MHRLRLIVSAAAFCAAVCSGAAAHGQVDPSLMLTPWPESAELAQGSVDVLVQDQGHVTSGPGQADSDVRILEAAARGRIRLVPPTDPDAMFDHGGVTLGLDNQFVHVDRDIAGAEFDLDLADFAAALGIGLGQFDGWDISLIAGGGHSYVEGDPGDNHGSAYALAGLVVSRRLDEQSDLTFVLDYNGNRSILPDVPLPGVVYSRRVSDDLRLSLGLPVSSLHWSPADRWSVDLRYVLPYSLDAVIGYRLLDELLLFASFETSLSAFRDGDGRDRIFYSRRLAQLGLTWTPWPNTSLTFAGGWAFDQEFTTGWDTRDEDEVFDVSDEPFLRAKIAVDF